VFPTAAAWTTLDFGTILITAHNVTVADARRPIDHLLFKKPAT
jgi:hypothetical protein